MTQESSNRIERTNELVDKEARALLNDIAISSSDIDSLIDLLKDKIMNSTDIANTIALARLFELKVDLYKKRTDVLKALVSDKSVDVGAIRRTVPDYSSLEAILGGAAIGAAAVAMSSRSVNPNTPYIDTNVEVQNVNVADIIVEVEERNLTPMETKEENLISGVNSILEDTLGDTTS